MPFAVSDFSTATAQFFDDPLREARLPLFDATVELLLVAVNPDGLALAPSLRMLWFVSIAGLTLVAFSTIVAINQLRFKRRVSREEQALLSLPASALLPMTDAVLPAPVARYRELALGAGVGATKALVRTLRLLHRGTFCMSPKAKPAAIVGQQVFTNDPPGFLWVGRVRLFPGVWVHARDMCVNGTGSMRVLVNDTVVLANAQGAELDQGSALRLLAEMVWYPTSLFDRRWVTWQAIDATHARATLSIGTQTVTAIFEFGAEGLPTSVQADRYMDRAEMRSWGGIYRDWRATSGMQVPFEVEVWWQLDTGRFTYAHWIIDSLVFDAKD